MGLALSYYDDTEEDTNEAKTSEIDRKPIAVITGVSKGIGHTSALKLIELGYTVIGCARNHAKMSEMSDKYPNHSFSQVDVSNAMQVKQWAQTVIHKYGSPQLLLLNASVAADQTLMENAPIKVLDDIIDVNVKGVMFVTKYFIKSMKDNTSKTSRIITISSLSGREGFPAMAPYCASKWAVEGLMKSVSKELPEHMFCCAYDPGGIVTSMTVYLIPELKGNLDKAIELGAIGSVQWAEVCVPHILSLNRDEHNGEPVERPNCRKLFQKNWEVYVQIKQRYPIN